MGQRHELVPTIAEIADDSRQRPDGLTAIALGIVAVSVVEEQDAAGRHTFDHAPVDFFDTRAVGVPHAEGPSDDTLIETSRYAGNPRAAESVWSAEETWGRACGL